MFLKLLYGKMDIKFSCSLNISFYRESYVLSWQKGQFKVGLIQQLKMSSCT